MLFLSIAKRYAKIYLYAMRHPSALMQREYHYPGALDLNTLASYENVKKSIGSIVYFLSALFIWNLKFVLRITRNFLRPLIWIKVKVFFPHSPVRIRFINQWGGDDFDPHANPVADVLHRFGVAYKPVKHFAHITVDGPFLNNYLSCLSLSTIVFVSAEALFETSFADYSLNFIHSRRRWGGRYIKLPITTWVFLSRKELPFKSLQERKPQVKTKFCCFVVSSQNCWQRNLFFHLLNEYKKVDSLGRYLKNVDILLPSLFAGYDEYIKILSKYKFMICFENKVRPHYLTEKLFNALYAGALPVYWGDPLASSVFNVDSYIQVRHSSDIREQIDYMMEAITKVKECDKNESLYKEKNNALPVVDPEKHDTLFYSEVERLADLFENKGFLKAA